MPHGTIAGILITDLINGLSPLDPRKL